jgi:hypothetical protein
LKPQQICSLAPFHLCPRSFLPHPRSIPFTAGQSYAIPSTGSFERRLQHEIKSATEKSGVTRSGDAVNRKQENAEDSSMPGRSREKPSGRVSRPMEALDRRDSADLLRYDGRRQRAAVNVRVFGLIECPRYRWRSIWIRSRRARGDTKPYKFLTCTGQRWWRGCAL